MARLRYWKITPSEIESFRYDEKKLLNWEIKGVRIPEDRAEFIGVFMYRRGTPIDYTPIKGVVYYHNNISRDELPSITKFLKKRYGGEEMEKGERIFLKDSKEIYEPVEIAHLARELESQFNVKTVITLEFHEMQEDEARECGLPDAKLLPIPGT